MEPAGEPDAAPEAERLTVLAGQHVSVTGRLVAVTRSQLTDIVQRSGGVLEDRVTASTTLLVLGAGGWPLQANGRLTSAFDNARRLQLRGHALEILPEADFLRRVDAQGSPDVLQHYLLPELAELLDVPPLRLQSWVEAGLLRPVEIRNGVAWFDFSEVTRCRSLCRLTSAGVSGKRLLRAIHQLEDYAPEAASLMEHLRVDGQRLVVRHADGTLSELHGQKLLEFDDELIPARLARDTRTLFDEAVACEETGDVEQAIEKYQELVKIEGPDPDVLFNLGNLLNQSGEFEEACVMYEQALRLDPEFAEAWSNLGILMGSQGRRSEGIKALRRAIDVDPTLPEALYGMAVTLDQCGRDEDAERYWKAYLYREPVGERADYARERVGES